MNLTESLLHMDYLQVAELGFCEGFCGSDQEWFSTQRQRLIGRGCFYQKHPRLFKNEGEF